MAGARENGATTFPRLLHKHAAERGHHPATREKDLGIWQTWTWSEVEAEVRALANETVPMLEEHLKTIKAIEAKMQEASTGGAKAK